jgi:hypothetical protein
MKMKNNIRVPEAPSVEYETLQVRGVRKEYIEMLKDQAHDLGYASYGEYMNALLREVFGEVGNPIQKKGRRAS